MKLVNLFQLSLLAMLLSSGCVSYHLTAAKPANQKAPATAAKPIKTALPERDAHAAGSPHHVVMLLPLSGTLAAAGTAIHDGYIAAQQQSGNKMVVDAIDTGEVKPISAAYQQALAKGADIIIGPLAKDAVAELASHSAIPVTTIALNYSRIGSNSDADFYQFGLSPLDEAKQTAERAALDGHRNALIITPAGDWGNGVTQAFESSWTRQGGNVYQTVRFKLQDNLAEQLKSVIGSIPRQKQHDFDVVLLAAPPAIARQLKPLLTYAYAEALSVYATSFIYAGTPQPLVDRDLNGIIFCDIPWVLQPPELALKLEKKDPRNFVENSRLYALGVDAYRLTLQLKDLRASSGAYILGATGNLYLTTGQQIVRRLTWAKFEDGQPVVLDKLRN